MADIHSVPPPGDPDSGVDTRLIWRVAVGLAIGTLVSGAAMLVLFEVERRHLEKADPAVPAMADAREARGRSIPSPSSPPAPPDAAGPPLQRSPAADMAALRAAEEAQLGTYGWTDREAGLARVPVTRAMEIVAKDGVAPLAAPPPEENAP